MMRSERVGTSVHRRDRAVYRLQNRVAYTVLWVDLGMVERLKDIGKAGTHLPLTSFGNTSSACKTVSSGCRTGALFIRQCS